MPRPPDPQLDPVGYLKSLGAVRERSKIVTEKALRNDLKHFDVDMDMFPHVVNFVARIIKVSDRETWNWNLLHAVAIELLQCLFCDDD